MLTCTGDTSDFWSETPSVYGIGSNNVMVLMGGSESHGLQKVTATIQSADYQFSRRTLPYSNVLLKPGNFIRFVWPMWCARVLCRTTDAAYQGHRSKE